MNQKGFTLIEVLASVAILGLGIVGVIRLFSGSLGLAKASFDSTAGVLFAKQKMAEMLLEENAGDSKGESEGFNWAMSVKDFDASESGPKLKEVDLVVNGAGAQVRMTTLKLVPPGK